jgi:hypothetical protein
MLRLGQNTSLKEVFPLVCHSPEAMYFLAALKSEMYVEVDCICRRTPGMLMNHC